MKKKLLLSEQEHELVLVFNEYESFYINMCHDQTIYPIDPDELMS